MDEVLEVAVQQDHLSSLVGGRATPAIAELVWNAVDADATEVSIRFRENGLGGLDQIAIRDNGHGMSREEIQRDFAALGGSWKRLATGSRTAGRLLHGSGGRGRWRAYALGENAIWTSVSANEDGQRYKVTVQGHIDEPKRFHLGAAIPTTEPAGTVVVIDTLTPRCRSLREESSRHDLVATFASYLEAYPVKIAYDGETLDPRALQEHRTEYQLDAVTITKEDVFLTVVEWSQDFDRALFLCDERGITLGRTTAGIQAPAFHFTAYIKSKAIRDAAMQLPWAEQEGFPVEGVSGLIPLAREQLRSHFRERLNALLEAQIQRWKDEKAYPYPDDAPASEVEAAERDLFDVVALAAASAVDRSGDIQAKRFTLSLIRVALEQDPGSLHRVMQQVLGLSRDRLEELDELLKRTTLTSVITIGKRVADRLDFLQGLSMLLFNPESAKVLRERTQLHRILAREQWVFGEEYNLMVDDESLTAALERHIGELGRTTIAPVAPVHDEEGTTRILDLMFGRALRCNRDRREHLVVELKAPRVKIGTTEITQIENYAGAVAQDQRFDKTAVEWDFVLVGNELTGYAERRGSQAGQPSGQISNSNGIRIWVKTWSQLISECEHRLKFVQESLQYSAKDEDALRYLRKMHEKYLPDRMAGDQAS